MPPDESQPAPDARPDAALIDAANAGDESAFAALYFRYRDWVAKLALRFTASQDDALDVLQETFAYLWRKFPGFVLTAAMTTFLYPAVKNLSIAARRKRGRYAGDGAALESAADPRPATGPPPDRVRADLAAVLARLPEAQREVLLMRFVDDLSLQEIADALAVPLGTVKSRLHNALNALRSDPQVRHYFGKE